MFRCKTKVSCICFAVFGCNHKFHVGICVRVLKCGGAHINFHIVSLSQRGCKYQISCSRSYIFVFPTTFVFGSPFLLSLNAPRQHSRKIGFPRGFCHQNARYCYYCYCHCYCLYPRFLSEGFKDRFRDVFGDWIWTILGLDFDYLGTRFCLFWGLDFHYFRIRF